MNETRVVPVELIDEMVEAALNAPHPVIAFGTSMRDTYRAILQSQWTAMLSSAPPTDAAQCDGSDPIYGPDTREFWRDRYFERRAVIAKWHARAAELGFDGVNDVLEGISKKDAAQWDDARELRKMLAFAYSGANLYGDDGCLEDNSTNPCIDYINDPVAVIRAKIRERGIRQLEAQAQPQAVPGE